MDDTERAEFEWGERLGKQLMADLMAEVEALDAKLSEVKPIPGDPVAVPRTCLWLLGQTQGKVQNTERTVARLLGGNVPANIGDQFDQWNARCEQARVIVERALTRASAPVN